MSRSVQSTSKERRVAAIVTTYDDRDYVEAALDSIGDQRLAVDEIVVVDGGSTDGTRDVVRARDEVELIVDEGSTLAAARNTGIEATSASFVAFLDADDMWLPEKTHRQLAAFEAESDLGLVYTDFYRVTPTNERLGIRRAKSIPDDRFIESLFVRGAAILPSSVMVRRECLRETGGFDPRLERAEERDMWLRIGASWGTKRIAEPLVRRRERPDSLGADFVDRLEYEEAITEKLIDRYPRLQDLRAKREAHLQYRLGSAHLEAGRRRAAMRAFWTSITSDPWLYKSYLKGALSLFPADVARRIQDLYRRLTSRPG